MKIISFIVIISDTIYSSIKVIIKTGGLERKMMPTFIVTVIIRSSVSLLMTRDLEYPDI